MKYKKILVVYKKAPLDIYSKRSSQIRDMLASGKKLEDLEAEKEIHNRTLELVLKTLENDADIKFKRDKDSVYRGSLSKRLIKNYDLVIAVGGDGTIMDTSHYCKKKPVPIFGVNSDYRPEAADSSEGYFCGANVYDFSKKYEELKKGSIGSHKFTRLELELDGKKLDELVMNDILIAHNEPSATSRYVIEDNGVAEFQKSSGLIVATPASTWGTYVALKAGGKILPVETRAMQYVEREHGIGRLNPDPKLETGITKSLKVASKMREGKVWIDGKFVAYNFGIGSELNVKVSGNPQEIIGFNESQRSILKPVAEKYSKISKPPVRSFDLETSEGSIPINKK